MALHIVTHPLVQHKLSLMRNKGTGVKEFRELTEETAMLICYEAMRDLPLKTVKLETPQGWSETKIISGKKLAFVPILRAGLGLIEGVTSLIPAAKIGHIGIFCEPGTHDAVKYYSKMPDDIQEREVVVIDAMLATGSSAIAAIQDLKDMGVKNITKAHAVETLLAHLGADRTDTIAFGDAKVDIPMFEACAYGVAMGSGGDEIKAAADYVTTGVNEDGLYHAFAHLGLI